MQALCQVSAPDWTLGLATHAAQWLTLSTEPAAYVPTWHPAPALPAHPRLDQQWQVLPGVASRAFRAACDIGLLA